MGKINEEVKKKYESVAEHEYMSKFLPIFSHAETQIKATISKFFLENKSKRELELVLSKYIKEIEKKVPKNLPNRDAYINGLKKKTQKFIKQYYIKALASFGVILSILTTNLSKTGQKVPKINSPKQLNTYLQREKINYRMWEQAKAAVRVQDYPKKLKEYIGDFSRETIVTSEPGKKGISLWQKAELDVRYGKQMEMVEDARKTGNDLWWISSHPDCSERCEKLQGLLVSLSKHAKNPQRRYREYKDIKPESFICGEEDGYKVYSLTDIMNCTDKYGYNNMIICGFNCRHHLIKYEKGKYPPKEFNKADIKRMREVNNDLREMERQIRYYKTQEKLYNVKGDTKNAAICKHKAKVITKLYVDTCDKYGFAVEEYRIKI